MEGYFPKSSPGRFQKQNIEQEEVGEKAKPLALNGTRGKPGNQIALQGEEEGHNRNGDD